MFFAIRRAILVGIYLVLAAIGYYLWTQRDRLDPIVIWVKAWQGRDERGVDTLASLTGQVLRVDGMDRIQLAGPNGQLWNVGATGLMPRKDRNLRARVEAEKKCQQFLQSILVSNQVRVELTYTNGRNALGLLYVGETNVNAELIRSGMARLQPQYIRFLPVNKQYPLLIADRQARERATVIAQAQNK